MMRNWGSRTDRYLFGQTVPENNKSIRMASREPEGLFFVKRAPILIIILVFLFSSAMTMDYPAWAKRTDTIPSPIGKDVSVDPGQASNLISKDKVVREKIQAAARAVPDHLRPRSIAERGDGLLGLASRSDKPGALDYRKRRQLHDVIGDATLVVLRNGGPILVYGLGENGELTGEKYVVSGEAVEVKDGALPRYIPTDKIPPERPEAVELIGLPSPIKYMTPRPVNFKGMKEIGAMTKEAEFSL